MGRDLRAPPQTITTGGDMSMSASAKALAAIVAAVLVLLAAAGATPHLKKVGHEPLMKRGMNAAIAIHGDYAYIGSRTDGGHEDMPHGGIKRLAE
jgi:hypothetical protein